MAKEIAAEMSVASAPHTSSPCVIGHRVVEPPDHENRAQQFRAHTHRDVENRRQILPRNPIGRPLNRPAEPVGNFLPEWHPVIGGNFGLE